MRKLVWIATFSMACSTAWGIGGGDGANNGGGLGESRLLQGFPRVRQNAQMASQGPCAALWSTAETQRLRELAANPAIDLFTQTHPVTFESEWSHSSRWVLEPSLRVSVLALYRRPPQGELQALSPADAQAMALEIVLSAQVGMTPLSADFGARMSQCLGQNWRSVTGAHRYHPTLEYHWLVSAPGTPWMVWVSDSTQSFDLGRDIFESLPSCSGGGQPQARLLNLQILSILAESNAGQKSLDAQLQWTALSVCPGSAQAEMVQGRFVSRFAYTSSPRSYQLLSRFERVRP